MAINIYSTNLGLFTIAVGDDIYSALSTFQTGTLVTTNLQGPVLTSLGEALKNVIPVAEMPFTFVISETAEYSSIRYLMLTEILPLSRLKSLPYSETNITTDYVVSGSLTKKIHTVYKNNADRTFLLNWQQSILLGNNTILTDANCPYGLAGTYSAYDQTISQFRLNILFANSNMTNFGNIRIISGYSGQNRVELESKTIYSASQNANLQLFFDGLEPLPPGPSGEDTDPYAEIDGESEITGGGTGTVSVPGFPGLTSTGTGIIGLFAPSAAQMQALGSFMWTDFGGQGTTTEDILKEIVEALKRSISNPLDYVIGLNIIPSQGLSIGESAVIRFGFISSGVSMPRLSNQYFTVDCGTLDFDPICGDTFLDYAPYSKFSIYLPYIGVKEVDANDFVGHTIGVVYHGDTVTGGVTAYITKDGSVMYQYSGCCALNIPLSADNWGNTISGAVQIATSIVGAAASGGAAGIAQAAVSGVASVAANPSMLSPQVAHSGAVSGGAGCMAVQTPFVIREAVRFHSTDYFNTVAGYPAFYYRNLGNVSGYTKVLEIHLKGMTATQEEVTEIETLLKQGAIF